MFTVTEKPELEIKTTLFKDYRILNKDTDYQNLVSMLNVLSGVTPEFGENSTLRNLVEYF